MYRFSLWGIIFVFFAMTTVAQFPPQYPEPGNDAIAANDPLIVGWATHCSVQRGWKNIEDTSLGKTTVGDSTSPLGSPDLNVVSLGDGGHALLTFDPAIKNGSGPDFAVFENGFNNPVDSFWAYLEFAFVEVSSDGVHYVRFPAISNTQDTQQIDNFTYMDASKVNNLAGKYVNGYGTPFDLQELAGRPHLDINHVRYVRIVDVVGSIDSTVGSFDSNGHIINDPFPSPYPSGGFDLSAVAVLHQADVSAISDLSLSAHDAVWPNPASDFLILESVSNGETIYQLTDMNGRVLAEGTFQHRKQLSLDAIPPGIYLLQRTNKDGRNITKVCIR